MSAQHRFFDPKLVRTRHLTSAQRGFLSEAGSDKPFDEFVVSFCFFFFSFVLFLFLFFLWEYGMGCRVGMDRFIQMVAEQQKKAEQESK